MVSYRTPPAFKLFQSLWPELLTNLFRPLILLSCVEEANGGLLFERNFLIVVDATAARPLLSQLNSSCLKLSLLLQACQPARLLQLLFPRLPLGLLSPVRETKLTNVYGCVNTQPVSCLCEVRCTGKVFQCQAGLVSVHCT